MSSRNALARLAALGAFGLAAAIGFSGQALAQGAREGEQRENRRETLP